MARELFIVRHAKSDWDSDAPSDFQRPLNKRGRSAAVTIADRVARNIELPVRIVSSPALRAWQTAVAISTALKMREEEIQFDGELYLAPPNRMISILSKIPNDIPRVMLVGHNPGSEELLEFLLKEPVPRTDNGKILPTATVARVQFNCDWDELDRGVGKLVKMIYPK